MVQVFDPNGDGFDQKLFMSKLEPEWELANNTTHDKVHYYAFSAIDYNFHGPKQKKTLASYLGFPLVFQI